MVSWERSNYVGCVGEVVVYGALLERLVSELISWVFMKKADAGSISMLYHIGFSAKIEILKNICKADDTDALKELGKLIEKVDKYNAFRNLVAHGGVRITADDKVEIFPLATAKQYSKKPRPPITVPDMQRHTKEAKIVADRLTEYVESYRADAGITEDRV